MKELGAFLMFVFILLLLVYIASIGAQLGL
jgi:hypothetical protein